MSFLIDPALLYAQGRAYSAVAGDDRPAVADAAVAATTLAVFWGVSVGLYLDKPWTRPIWRACRAESGRDWMLNSGVTRFDWRRAGPRTHAISAAIFFTYPLWLLLGMRSGRR
ncbi:MAG: hypothetical protein WD993_03085 [Thermoleophilaceae bacterium]